MADSESKLIPISAISLPGLTTDLTFPPYVRTKEIGLRVDRVKRLARLARFSEVNIVGDFEGHEFPIEGDEPLPAGKNRFKQHRLTPNQPSANTPASCSINVDLGYLNDVISSRKGNIRSSADWARFLDQHIRFNILTAGRGNLSSFRTTYEAMRSYRMLFLASTFTYYGVSALAFSHIPGFIECFTLFCATNTATNILRSREWMNRNSIPLDENNGMRWSMFYGPQRDRAMMLCILTNFPGHKLVEPIK